MTEVSIVLPVYNVEPFLERCLDSLFSQTFRDFEIVAIDDGSTDNSGYILDLYSKLDSRVMVVHKANGGVSSARNEGIELSTGEYIFFCDPDDWLEEQSLGVMYNEAKRCGADVVISDFFRDCDGMSSSVKLFPGNFATTDKGSIGVLQNAVLYSQASTFSSSAFSRVNSFGGAAWHHLIKRALVEEHGIRFDSYLDGMLEDGLFMLHVFQHAASVAYFQFPTYHYCVSLTSSTHRFLPDFEEKFNRVCLRLSEFERQFDKGDDFRQARYMRLISFIGKACEVFYFNPENRLGQSERYAHFKQLVQGEPYRSAIKQVDIRLFEKLKTRIQVLALKMGLIRAFWNVKKRRYS
ncbi:glycosyltransferase [Eggerthella guodeyinii]|uniref:Glycosyltransferase n=1 Tax=Eggerthella guodeyinii TaxID=2690837 RepID=A0A6L7IXU8_9ACTN|nr:glycosyltransferase family 2 protein [Eggerthella guodeyinii]QOS67601.1 glycosyltransferase [Eggerthella guodeyinii]